MEFLKFIFESVKSAVAGGILIAALACLFRSWIAERLKNAIRHEYDRDIEAYRAALASAYSATAEGQKAAIDARFKAFDRIWKAVLALRNNVGFITTFLDILTVDEYKDIKDHKDFTRMVGELDENKLQRMSPDSQIEETRPYVGEVVWSLFFAYQAINIRIVFLAWSAVYTDEEKIYWYRDDGTLSLLRLALTKAEMDKFESLKIGKIAYFRKVIEGKLLASWRNLLSGAEFGEEALVHAQSIISATSKVTADKAPQPTPKSGAAGL
jgi:hypothetical protein